MFKQIKLHEWVIVKYIYYNEVKRYRWKSLNVVESCDVLLKVVRPVEYHCMPLKVVGPVECCHMLLYLFDVEGSSCRLIARSVNRRRRKWPRRTKAFCTPQKARTRFKGSVKAPMLLEIPFSMLIKCWWSMELWGRTRGPLQGWIAEVVGGGGEHPRRSQVEEAR